MSRAVWIALLAFLSLGCAGLPPIAPVAGGRASPAQAGACSVFPQGDWQFLHSIKAEMAGGASFVSMGVTVISSRQRSNRSIIMTFEGFVVFDAAYGEDGAGLIVHRALPPFDSPHFAAGMMEDIRMIFFEPEGTLLASGMLTNGSAACRYRGAQGGFIDVERRSDGGWELKRYSREKRLVRSARALNKPGIERGFPAMIELAAHGSPSYKLELTLVEAIAP